ncbi:hypothetical protein CONCODRAFT_13097 [Conidiobolus coronatus NRRL 28638]|uniref:Zn(2)-C6 fungal-type domain-containing protein n=1 Tax=Conidiobolus coronatus (strain ATCC 28846 / CBS 209.66 / NRRL 28638) TaxID=796925 RepID=A0A137NRE6_CONC2|nr:hypothetical protein CONCODRAFT_13097 [Conidiobolus coronatus NRRL 28638]|eukprot:KXN65346.1 hypothetical protein CONCODRAFT_13097 [Conidiobolus coronatus NRRL 28638]
MNKSETLINCNTCKIRKVKCSRELPNCSYCSERDLLCIYPDKIKRRGASEVKLTSFVTKMKAGSGFKPHKRASRDSENNEIQVNRFTLFQPVPQIFILQMGARK